MQDNLVYKNSSDRTYQVSHAALHGSKPPTQGPCLEETWSSLAQTVGFWDLKFNLFSLGLMDAFFLGRKSRLQSIFG